jgi:ribosomal protein S18 acetylase RimI-like enzyme
VSETNVEIHEVQSPAQLDLVRVLFREYAAGLGVDLCFQGFETELENLPGRYSRPQGGLWLATIANRPAACVAFRQFDATTAEMKRLYVRPNIRGLGLGRRLIDLVLTTATLASYQQVWLDTLPSMAEAIRLYRQIGFEPIAPYYDNPVPGALFLGKSLIRK